ncbi:ABC transporter substrate-binding protein [Yinghuangia seranimata]|uniref:ABC transporter substrate-binding protein n=1 Tax=Yinghuangia seranimata TaxID=408067 RepID=UPI00248BECFB|nr:ABC transporter substrate-binding protein [Yinghuangia seranimata]MDI2129289.1 ABC transporter substrate-binding protein [Yinghuangia seranimata]
MSARRKAHDSTTHDSTTGTTELRTEGAISRGSGLARLRSRGVVVAGIAALALTATACGGDKDKKKDASASGAPAAGKSGGKVTMLAVQDSKSLDPFRTSYVAVADEPRMAALYDPMFYIDAKSGKVVPFLADSLTSADNGATWTLKLKQGVQFSDGTPFDAAAVKLNWETHAKPETQSLHRAYAAELGIEVVDPLTLKVTPPRMPNPNFDKTVAQHLSYIEAPSAINKGLDAAGTAPVGAGPFMLKSWTRGSAQEFVKNPNYWQKDKGLPKLDGLTIKNVPDLTQQLNSVKSGSADIFMSSDPKALSEGKKAVQAQVQEDLGGQLLGFNMAKAPFDDQRARRAIALALDPNDIPKTLDNGYVPAKSFFNTSSAFFDPQYVQPAPNKDEAQSLFNALAAEGKKVDFTLLVPKNPAADKVAELFKSRLEAFQNVSVKIDSIEIGQYIVKYAIQKDFQGILFQQWLLDPEPEMFNTFISPSPLNYFAWKNPKADAALLAGRTSTDPEARKKAYSDLQKEMAEDLPVWAYAQSQVGPIYSKKVTGVEMYGTGNIFLDRLALS